MRRTRFCILLISSLTTAASSLAVFERGGPLGFGTRAMGMGGAWVAAGGDMAALYWNPAGLVNVKDYPQLMFIMLHSSIDVCSP